MESNRSVKLALIALILCVAALGCNKEEAPVVGDNPAAKTVVGDSQKVDPAKEAQRNAAAGDAGSQMAAPTR